jgi:hypothetical protein
MDKLVLRNIIYANTIAAGILFEDFVAMLNFSNKNVRQ